MKRVHIIHDPYKLNESTVADVENPLEYLKSEFKDGFPEHAKIYKGSIAVENDITEKLQKDELLINLIDDDIWVVIWPAWIQFVFYAVTALTAALSIYMYLTMPQPAISAAGSSNNDLASRQNRARLGGRVPEIFGQLRAVPDLIASPFTYYDENNREIEECLMVLGRGYYQIHDAREDTTDVLDIPDSAVSVYDPDTSINGIPIFKIGQTFTEPPLMTTKSKSINGQPLDVPNDEIIRSSKITFKYPNIIKANDSLVDFTEIFSNGETVGIYSAEYFIDDISIAGFSILSTSEKITIESPINIQNIDDFNKIVLSNAIVSVTTEILPIPPETESTYITRYYDLSGRYNVDSVIKTQVGSNFKYEIQLSGADLVNPNWNYLDVDKNASINIVFTDNRNSINLNGSYQISSVSASEILISSPQLINADWLKLDFIPSKETNPVPDEVRLDKFSDKWVGWFNIEQDNTNELIFNLFFQNGLFYQDSKGGVWDTSMTVNIEYQYIDTDNTPIGSVYSSLHTVTNNSKSSFGTTVRIVLASSGRVRFRIGRTTKTQNDKTQDLCKIKDVYAAAKSNLLHYQDVTIVRSRTLGTEGALALKERKLNCLVTRKLPLNGTGALTPTKSAAQALIYLALDPKNGRRSTNEVDIAQILAEEQAVINYFGNSKAAEFSYTIDDNNLSFEEIAGMVASAMFCEAYRYGNKLRIRFEQPQQNSILLFNAANKAPNTEKRTKSFGVENKYDGVEVEYASPDDDTRITYTASDTPATTNAMQIKTSGIRSHEQAKTRAWREWNKLKYRNINCEFEALEESELLARNDRILVADNTVIKTKDGIIDFVDGLTLGLSHPIESDVPYFIYLQLADGRVDIVPCSYIDEYTVLLSRPPLIALVPEFTTYQLIESTETPSNAFMVTEIRPQGKMTNMLTCVNYDERYYQNDADFF